MKTRAGTVLRTVTAAIVASATLTGCDTYQMRGVVIEGAVSAIQIVDEDDPRLSNGNGLPMATIDVTLDPDRLSRKHMPRGISEVDGTFAVPIDEQGAGYLDYQVRVVVRRAGHDSALSDLRVPGPHSRLLVTLVNGEDKYQPEPPDLMDETLKMGEPYMR
jgi:hypothetical protein